jgi:hypothetical protein
MEIALHSLTVSHDTGLNVNDSYYNNAITPTQRQCSDRDCVLKKKCNHYNQHNHHYSCVRDSHSGCPSCKIVALRKVRKRNNKHNYDPLSRAHKKQLTRKEVHIRKK